MVFVVWFQIAAGVAMIGLWSMLLVTRQVPEIPAGDRGIWFHLAAEVLTAVLLATAGVWQLAGGSDMARALSALALGALLYTAVNSAGYYADREDWRTVGLFSVLTIGAVGAAAVVVAAG